MRRGLGRRPRTVALAAEPAQVSSLPTVRSLEPLGARERRRLARYVASRRATIMDAWSSTHFDAERLQRYRIEGVDGSAQGALLAGFIAPLLDLLIEYIRTGESRYRDIYLDERLRYAPFRAAPATRAAFFREVLTPDEDAVLGAVPAASRLGPALRNLLTELHQPLVDAPARPAVRVLGLGDCLLNELRVFLPARCRRDGVALDLRCLYFKAAADRPWDVDAVLRFLADNPMDLVAISFLTYTGIPAYRALLREADTLSRRAIDGRVEAIVQLMQGCVRSLRAGTDIPLLIHDAGGLPLSRWRGHLPFVPPISPRRRYVLDLLNAAIRDLVRHTSNAILIDEDAVARQHGHRSCAQLVVPRRLVRQAMFHTARLGEYLSEPYAEIVSAYDRLHQAKAVLVDFDGALWDGERQELLRELKEAGILLLAVSAHDLPWGEMMLEPSDFTWLEISARRKVDAIREAARELDVGLDAFVLVDDSPAERELVESQLPAVVTLDPLDPFTWRSLEWMLQFPNTRETEEARSRTDLYRHQAARRVAVTGTFDYPTMMAGLELKATFGRVRESDVDRVTELMRRTNQFNTTMMPFSQPELRGLLRSECHRLYAAELSDKFGNLGLVAVAILEQRGCDAVLRSFVMSCRAMGLQFERLVLRLVLDAEGEPDRFIGRLVPTDRNTAVMGLFRACGFRPHGPNEWVLERGMPRPDPPEWFAIAARR